MLLLKIRRLRRPRLQVGAEEYRQSTGNGGTIKPKGKKKKEWTKGPVFILSGWFGVMQPYEAISTEGNGAIEQA